MTVRTFGTLDDMLHYLTARTDDANARVKPSQLELRKGDYYAADSGAWYAIFGQLREDPNDQGYADVHACSCMSPEGEFGGAHISTMVPLSPQEFEVAKAARWRNTDVVLQALQRMAKADEEATREN